MTKDEELNYWIDVFRKNAIIWGETSISGDYKTGNKSSKKMSEAFKEIKKLDYPNFDSFVVLLEDSNVSVVIEASDSLLDTKHHKKAKKKLSDIVESGIPILRLDAELILTVWNEKNSWWAKMKKRFSL